MRLINSRSSELELWGSSHLPPRYRTRPTENPSTQETHGPTIVPSLHPGGSCQA